MTVTTDEREMEARRVWPINHRTECEGWANKIWEATKFRMTRELSSLPWDNAPTGHCTKTLGWWKQSQEMKIHPNDFWEPKINYYLLLGLVPSLSPTPSSSSIQEASQLSSLAGRTRDGGKLLLEGMGFLHRERHRRLVHVPLVWPKHSAWGSGWPWNWKSRWWVWLLCTVAQWVWAVLGKQELWLQERHTAQ